MNKLEYFTAEKPSLSPCTPDDSFVFGAVYINAAPPNFGPTRVQVLTT
jgi:hypothetical protein